MDRRKDRRRMNLRNIINKKKISLKRLHTVWYSFYKVKIFNVLKEFITAIVNAV